MISSKTSRMPRASLSAITAMTPMSGLKAKASVIARRSRPGAMWVVGGVENYRRRAADEFQPARKVHLGESLADHIRVQRLQSEKRLGRGERLRGIRGLVRPVERQKDFIDRAVRAGEPEDLPGHRELAVDDAEVDALPLRQARRPRRIGQARPRAASMLCPARMACAPGLMMPAFSRVISVIVRPSRWV